MCHGHWRRWSEGKRGADLESPIRNYGVGEVDLLDDSGPDIPALVYDTEWKRFCDWMGIRKERKAPILKADSKHVLHGVLSDLHIPFHDTDAILEAVEWFKSEGVSSVHLAGDVCDHYSLSRFSQYQLVPIQAEAIEVRKVMDLLSRSFAVVNVMQGNHEAREQKYLAARLPADLLSWYIGKGFIARTCADMPNVKMVSRTVSDTDMHWLSDIGDVIIAHAESASKITLRAAENVRVWMDVWHDALALARPRIVFQAHTHNAGIARVGRQLVSELGCCCKIQGYALEPRLYPKPQVQAATIFEQCAGATNLNSIHQRYLGIK
jgi:hypothetical protein